jgi:DNA-binding response OmpR family regulator
LLVNFRSLTLERLPIEQHECTRNNYPTQNCSQEIEYWCGRLRLNTTTHEVTYGGEPLRLTPKEFAILDLLIAKGRRVFSRAEIVQRIWSGDELPLEETVKSHIKSLRHKLREAGMAEDPIETVHGVGY